MYGITLSKIHFISIFNVYLVALQLLNDSTFKLHIKEFLFRKVLYLVAFNTLWRFYRIKTLTQTGPTERICILLKIMIIIITAVLCHRSGYPQNIKLIYSLFIHALNHMSLSLQAVSLDEEQQQSELDLDIHFITYIRPSWRVIFLYFSFLVCIVFKKAFAMFDSAKTGSIEKEKVRTILNTLGHTYDDSELQEMLDAEDVEG